MFLGQISSFLETLFANKAITERRRMMTKYRLDIKAEKSRGSGRQKLLGGGVADLLMLRNYQSGPRSKSQIQIDVAETNYLYGLLRCL